MRTDEYDLTVVGAGIVGLATAMALRAQCRRGMRICLLEKEPQPATHQTGHNSGAIHSGIYYRPGSLKARLCVQGARALVDFCKERGIPYELCGKVVVATSPEELLQIQELYHRGIANGVPGLRLIGPEQIRELEPHVQGIQGLHVPGAGIVDYKQVALEYKRLVEENGAEIRTSTKVLRVIPGSDRLAIETNRGAVHSRFLINCAGLHSDRVARSSHSRIGLQIIPFRGEYYELIPSRRGSVRGLIYPVPNPHLPFLGVHLSRTIDGRVEAGPNAVLAFKREGYKKTDLNLADLGEMLSFPGFWKMAGRFWRTGLEEMHRSFSKPCFVRSVQRLIPSVQEADLVPAGAGVRAQAVDAGGALLDDFHLIQNQRTLHVLNAPSPAATASIAIGRTIAERALRQFSL